MKIVLNGQERDMAAPLTLAQLLESAGYANHRIAVEINREIVSRRQHAEHLLRAGDHVEIVHAIGGG